MAKNVDNIMDPIEIRWKGVYDFDGLYKTIRGWLDHKRYDFMESLYKDKVASEFGNEVEIKMEPELKVTEYIKYHISIFMKNFEFREFEATIDGQKKGVSDGRIIIRLKCSVELDYNNKYKTEGQKKIQNFMVDKVLDRYFEYKYYDKLAEDVYALADEIKRFLKMES
jgi:hypothetical protein